MLCSLYLVCAMLEVCRTEFPEFYLQLLPCRELFPLLHYPLYRSSPPAPSCYHQNTTLHGCHCAVLKVLKHAVRILRSLG